MVQHFLKVPLHTKCMGKDYTVKVDNKHVDYIDNTNNEQRMACSLFAVKTYQLINHWYLWCLKINNSNIKAFFDIGPFLDKKGPIGCSSVMKCWDEVCLQHTNDNLIWYPTWIAFVCGFKFDKKIGTTPQKHIHIVVWWGKVKFAMNGSDNLHCGIMFLLV